MSKTIDYNKIKNDDDLMLPSVDYVFCRLFGSQNSKERLISLLNSILVGKPYIKDVTIDPTEYRKDKKYGKSIRLDVKATTDTGVLIDVEMQCGDVGDIFQRSSFINATMLRDYTIDQGGEYIKIPDRIIIWFTMKNVNNRKSCFNEVVQMYKANHIDPVEIASEHEKTFIIELSKMEQMDMTQIDEMLEGWMRFIKDPKKLAEKYLSMPIMQDALTELEYLSHDKEARKAYNDRMVFLNYVHTGMTEHYERGLKEGEEIGVERGKMEAAINAFKYGLSIEQAASIACMDVREFKKIVGSKN